jgi:hypothetical protein
VLKKGVDGVFGDGGFGLSGHGWCLVSVSTSIFQPWPDTCNPRGTDWGVKRRDHRCLKLLRKEPCTTAQRIAAVRMVDLFENQIRMKAFQSRSENFKPSIRQSSWP